MASLTTWQQSEVVRKKQFPIWQTQKFNVLLDFIKKGEVEKIGERDFRIPAELEFGGRAGTADLQMGDMGRGSMPQGLAMIQSFFTMRLNFEFDKLSIQATTDKSVAIQSPFLKTVAKGYQEMKIYVDKWYHGDGTAVLATATAFSNSSNVTVYTLDAAFGSQLLRRGQYVTVYNNGLTTINSAGVLRITGINALTLTLSGIVPGAAATDKICFEGVSGATPTGPRGLAYWLSSATTGTTAGINRANESQIISKSVDASGTPYNVEHVMGLYDKILNDRAEVASELFAICAPAQRAAAFNQMMAIQNILLDGTKTEAVDRLPSLKGKPAFMYGGVPHFVDIHADTTKVYFMASSLWGRAVLSELDFYQTDGKSGADGRFIQLYGSSGGPANGVWFGLLCSENPYTIDPGAQGVIYGLPRPAFH